MENPKAGFCFLFFFGNFLQECLDFKKLSWSAALVLMWVENTAEFPLCQPFLLCLTSVQFKNTQHFLSYYRAERFQAAEEDLQPSSSPVQILQIPVTYLLDQSLMEKNNETTSCMLQFTSLFLIYFILFASCSSCSEIQHQNLRAEFTTLSAGSVFLTLSVFFKTSYGTESKYFFPGTISIPLF